MQKQKYSPSRSRPLGARNTPSLAQPGKSQRVVEVGAGASLARRGLIRMRSNRRELKSIDEP